MTASDSDRRRRARSAPPDLDWREEPDEAALVIRVVPPRKLMLLAAALAAVVVTGVAAIGGARLLWVQPIETQHWRGPNEMEQVTAALLWLGGCALVVLLHTLRSMFDVGELGLSTTELRWPASVAGLRRSRSMAVAEIAGFSVAPRKNLGWLPFVSAWVVRAKLESGEVVPLPLPIGSLEHANWAEARLRALLRRSSRATAAGRC